MKLTTRLFLYFFLSLAFASTVFAQTVPLREALPPHIAATGLGELRLPPDYAVILFAVETSGTDAAIVGRDNASRMDSLREGLVKQGVPEQSMSTIGYTLRNEARFQEKTQKEQSNWFVARNGIRVPVTNLERVGATIDAALASGANQVDDVSFRVADERVLKRKALSAAVIDARAKAETMADAAGGKLGALIDVTSSDTQAYEGSLYMFNAKVSAETGISRAEITITERVVARWRFNSNAP